MRAQATAQRAFKHSQTDTASRIEASGVSAWRGTHKTLAICVGALLATGCGPSRSGSPGEGDTQQTQGGMPATNAEASGQTGGSAAGNAPSSGATTLEGGLPEVSTAQENALVGQGAPDFEVPLRNGTTLSLAGLRGKVVVLNFWATWCPPCIEEIPALNRLYRSVEGLPIEVIGISVDDSWAKVDEMLLKRPVAFTLALDTGRGIPSRFGTEKFPETFILDKSGKVVKKLIGAQLWDRGDMVGLLEELAKAPTP